MMTELEQANQIYQQEVQKWEQYLGIPEMSPPSQVEDILSMSIDNIRKQNNVALAEFAVMLSQYSFFLQREENKCKAFLQWVQSIAPVINDTQQKCRLNKWKQNINMRQTNVSFISRKTDLISEAISNLARSRAFQRRQDESS